MIYVIVFDVYVIELSVLISEANYENKGSSDRSHKTTY